MRILGLYPEERIKKEIYQDIRIIEDRFVFEKNINENDTSSYTGMLNHLKKTTITFCNQWKSIYEAKPMSEYINMEYDDFKQLMENDLDRHVFLIDSLYNTIYTRIAAIQIWELLVDPRHKTMINSKLETDLSNARNQMKESFKSNKIEVLYYLIQMNKDKEANKDYKRNLKKAINKYDELINNVEYLTFTETFLRYVLDCNNLFEASKEYYKNKEPSF